MSAVAQKPVRRFPPPCWTRDEALVLIEAYRERWHALHRAFLRTPDWDAVAGKLTATFPDVAPAKTAAQCRHKMEKLRQRHRVEKQRAAAFGGDRFRSSWFFFEPMEAMENGSSSEPDNNSPVKPEIQNPNPNPNPTISLNPGRGIRFKPSKVQNLVTLATSSTMKSTPNFNSRVPNPYPNPISNQDDLDHPDHPSRPGLRPRKFTKVVYGDEVDTDGEMWMKVPRNPNLFGPNSNDLNLGKNMNMNMNMKKIKKEKKSRGLSEVVSSIKLLSDGFMKMEKLKIDMAREIETMRMETEMKRNVLILESQKQIVDAFVKGLIESRKPKSMEEL